MKKYIEVEMHYTTVKMTLAEANTYSLDMHYTADYLEATHCINSANECRKIAQQIYNQLDEIGYYN